MSNWTATEIPDQSGRIAVVTGASSGLGLETAKALAERGASVVLACRDLDKAGRAASSIRVEVEVLRLDLASLGSVREAAEQLRSAHSRLDLLINNAGVMLAPEAHTADGFELTLATNHLGHFALTGLVLDQLRATDGSRVVTVTSLAHRRGVISFDDLHSERSYDASAAYAQSKLANLLFAYELQARLEKAGAPTIALAAHPGNVLTPLWRTSSKIERMLISPCLRAFNFWLAQSPQLGALTTLRAAVDPSARGGELYGPNRWFQFTGNPVRVESSARSHDVDDRRRLWEVSEELTGVSFGLPEAR